MLHGRVGVGELERLRAGVLAHDDRFQVAVRPHELPGGVQVVRDAGRVAVEVRAEQVEGVPSGAGEVVEELALRAAGLAAEHVVAAAAEDDRRMGVGVLDRAVEGLQLLDVLGRGADPRQVGVARLVVALPVAHPPRAVAHHLAHEFPVCAQVVGRRLGLEIGGHPGAPR